MIKKTSASEQEEKLNRHLLAGLSEDYRNVTMCSDNAGIELWKKNRRIRRMWRIDRKQNKLTGYIVNIWD